jgi:predicted permease
MLLVCAGLLASSMTRMGDVETGFDERGVLTFAVSLPGKKYGWPIETDRFYRTLSERIEAMPGVKGASVVWPLPLAGRRWDGPVQGGAIGPEAHYMARYELITPSFFETMRIPLIRGRTFQTDDPKRSVVVSRSFAERAWPGEDPLGRTIRAFPWGQDTVAFVVIGVAGGVRFESLRDAQTDVVYFDSKGYVWTDWEVNFVVRADGDLPALAESIRETLVSMDPDIPLADVKPLSALVHAEMATNRFARTLFTLFAVVAGFLALLGLYGIVAYNVRMRSREFGIRVALGSRPAGIVRLALHQGLRVTVAGLGVGLVSAFWAAGLLRGVLFGVTTTDPRVYAAAATGLALVAVLSALLPARRAARLDPARVLRAGG